MSLLVSGGPGKHQSSEGLGGGGVGLGVLKERAGFYRT